MAITRGGSMYVPLWVRAYGRMRGGGRGGGVPPPRGGGGGAGPGGGRGGCAPMGRGRGVGVGVGVGVGAGTRGSSTCVLEKVYKKARDYAGDCLYLAM